MNDEKSGQDVLPVSRNEIACFEVAHGTLASSLVPTPLVVLCLPFGDGRLEARA